MSETHYWPGEDEPGEYTVELLNGSTLDWYWNGDAWTRGGVVRSKNDMTDRCYIGVRREKPDSDNAAIAAQALAELRLCRKPFETERWAYEWGPKLCAMLGAE